MFDATKMTVAFVGGLIAHINPLMMHLYYMPPDLDPAIPLLDSPLKRDVELLVKVVNGKSQREIDVREALLAVSLVYGVIPPHLRTAEMKSLIDHAAVWLHRDELITLSEAAMLLRGSSEKRDLKWINDQLRLGKLTRYDDPDEPNPTKAGRVRRSEVEGLRDASQNT
jgi:hypothetical protein